MEKFEKLTGVAAPLPLINIDTDMIIPKQFLKTIKRSGLGTNLFDEMRFDDDGQEIPDFVLNQSQYREAEILVAGDNFGCGSSREHAPWAIKDFGIRCVIAPSFADIFYNNCFKNGILPIALPQDQVDVLMKDAEKGLNARMTVDLEAQTVTTSDGESFCLRSGQLQEALPAGRARRYWPDHGKGRCDLVLRKPGRGRAPLGLRPKRFESRRPMSAGCAQKLVNCLFRRRFLKLWSARGDTQHTVSDHKAAQFLRPN